MAADEKVIDWKWRMGVLNGLGECAWQKLGDSIRRVTKLIPMPDGNIMYSKTMISGPENPDKEPQFSASKLVIVECDIMERLSTPIQTLWERQGSIIMPGRNGGPRPM